MSLSEGGREGGNLWFIEVLTHLKKDNPNNIVIIVCIFVLIYWNRLEIWYCIICGGVELKVTTTLAILSCSKFHQ